MQTNFVDKAKQLFKKLSDKVTSNRYYTPKRMKISLIIIVVLGLGLLIFSGDRHQQNNDKLTGEAKHLDHSEHESKETIWTCSMHPQIKKNKPGQCPICGMDLIPLTTGSSKKGDNVRALEMSKEALKLAEITTVAVARKAIQTEIRMNGLVEYNETKLAYVTAWVGGRLDRLYVDYTGINVKKGDHMVYLYSPEIISAQSELLEAIKSVDTYGSAESAKATMEAAREKLRLWGLTKYQIAQVEKRGKPLDHITIKSPASGIVIKKHVQEGMYVKTGTKIYTIADLSTVWVKLDAYESDLPWIRYGQKVEFDAEAIPGEPFHGRISFIDPVLNQKTRTVKLRVNVDNSSGRLKPGMFVRATMRTWATKDGPLTPPDLKGKWISPMHPEIIKDKPGKCDVCGMPLVPIESMGYLTESKKQELPLVIPATAPLITGKRSVVYVKVPNMDQPTFEGKEIVLGPRAGDYYIVKSGLTEGEEVIVKGNFKIDSALQIQAKPSMMNPEGGGQTGAHNH